MEEPLYSRLKNSESDMKAVGKTFLRLLWLSKILATEWSQYSAAAFSPNVATILWLAGRNGGHLVFTLTGFLQLGSIVVILKFI